MKAALSTEGKMMTHSALSSKSGGMSSGMSRISLRTVPQLSRRSVSFLSSFAERGRATRAHDISNEINRLSTNHLDVVFWAKSIIEFPFARCNPETWFRNRSEEHTSELQSRQYLVCRLLLEKKKNSTP